MTFDKVVTEYLAGRHIGRKHKHLWSSHVTVQNRDNLDVCDSSQSYVEREWRHFTTMFILPAWKNACWIITQDDLLADDWFVVEQDNNGN